MNMVNRLVEKYLELNRGKKLYPPLNNCSAFVQGSGYNQKHYFKNWYKQEVNVDILVLMDTEHSQVWIPEDELLYTTRAGLNEYINDPTAFNRRVQFFYDSIAKMDIIYPTLTYSEIARKNWDELLAIVSQIRDLIWEANAAEWFSVYLDQDFCWQIIKESRLPLTWEELESMWERGTEASFESFDKAQLLDFLEILAAGKPWPQIVEHCQYFVTDYYSAKSLSKTEEVLKERYGKYLGNISAANKELQAEKVRLVDVQNKHQEWVRSLSENQKKVAEFLQLIMKIRDNRKNFFSKGLAVIYRIAERMFEEDRVSQDLIPFYSMQELLKGREYLDSIKEELEKRKAGFAFLVSRSGEYEIELGPVVGGMETMNQIYIEGHKMGSGEVLKGQIGCRGYVKGIVRIVINSDAFSKFKPGEILVAGMTRPEYVPLMKNAAAIVTDEGGITCHAAIVSRELNIPCVIGTKNATRVLKDGDLVEVDAEKGVVRIIK